MLLPHGTVVAVIDGRTLELYRNTGDAAAPELEALPSPALGTLNHSGAGHHSSTGNHEGNMVDEDAHAIAAAQWLNGEVLGHRLDKLVIIAPPRTLGELRRHFHKQTEQAIMHELNKDYVGKPPSEVLEALREKN